MAAKRRARGTLIGAKKIALTIEASANQELSTLAEAAGTTRSAMAQWLVENVATDEAGIPLGWVNPRDQGDDRLL